MLPKEIDNLVIAYEKVGSRITCNPPPTNTDLDILVLAKPKKFSILHEELESNNWFYDSNYSGADFTSYKKKGTDVNLIVTEEVEWYRKFLVATRYCREKNLLVKTDRIAVFDKIFERKSVKQNLVKTGKNTWPNVEAAPSSFKLFNTTTVGTGSW